MSKKENPYQVGEKALYNGQGSFSVTVVNLGEVSLRDSFQLARDGIFVRPGTPTVTCQDEFGSSRKHIVGLAPIVPVDQATIERINNMEEGRNPFKIGGEALYDNGRVSFPVTVVNLGEVSLFDSFQLARDGVFVRPGTPTVTCQDEAGSSRKHIVGLDPIVPQ